MTKLLYSVREVFETYLSDNSKHKTYNIPEYQRGYKWSKPQIEQLLNDIYSFKGENTDAFYCLQNITLVQNEAKNALNVVDGQQRLTTLSILLAYLGKQENVKGTLTYSIRQSSNIFLQNIINNQDQIREKITKNDTFKSFLEEIKKDGEFDFQDVFYMWNAYRTIHKWFESKNIDRGEFIKKLLAKVKLIVNLIKGNEQELFMNLNTGRVPLDGSDLVRAILITRVAKTEVEKQRLEETHKILIINQRRVRIGWELDEINSWWGKEDVKNYFSAFTNIKTASNETITFDHKKHPINLLYKLWVSTKGKKDIKLKHFESNETEDLSALNLYQDIIRLHRTLKDWFEDRVIYHYLGFIFNNTNYKFPIIWKKWNAENITRQTFKDDLKGIIKSNVFGSDKPEKNENVVGNSEESEEEVEENGIKYWLEKIIDYNENWYVQDKLIKILLLLDIIECSKEKEKGNPLPFLKPKFFKKIDEDKEHIYPSTPKKLKKLKDLSEVKDSVEKIDKYIKSINESIEGETISQVNFDKKNEEERQEILNNLENEIHKKTPINSIGNLVLLHQSINRGFGNNYYKDKRKTIIQLLTNGRYIRQHTLKVFLKQTENEDLNEWTMKDIKANAENIKQQIATFFNTKNKNTNG